MYPYRSRSVYYLLRVVSFLLRNNLSMLIMLLIVGQVSIRKKEALSLTMSSGRADLSSVVALRSRKFFFGILLQRQMLAS